MVYKCVSTNPDECKDVGCEIGAHSKRKATLYKVEHIVSAYGNIRLKRAEQRMVGTSMVSVSLRMVVATFVL